VAGWRRWTGVRGGAGNGVGATLLA